MLMASSLLHHLFPGSLLEVPYYRASVAHTAPVLAFWVPAQKQRLFLAPSFLQWVATKLLTLAD